jgi:phosphoribosylanthranilate isomerase
MKLKVCGMRDQDNIHALSALKPDYMGFIFYEASPRYAGNLPPETLRNLSGVKKVGVFVNASQQAILHRVEQFGLDMVQLHGDESLEQVEALHNEGLSIIKVFRIHDSIPENSLDFAPYTALFLFDTRTEKYGGSGKKFDWNLLREWQPSFLLSGGIGPEDVIELKKWKNPALLGIDVNSRVEITPGLKDISKIKEIKKII